MLLDDNYGVTVYKITAKELQPNPLAIKYQLRF